MADGREEPSKSIYIKFSIYSSLRVPLCLRVFVVQFSQPMAWNNFLSKFLQLSTFNTFNLSSLS